MSGIARSVLLRAKGSIDHIRGASEQDEQDKPHRLPARSYSSARGSLKADRSEDDHSQHRGASLSLRRVLTTSSRRSSKRASLFVNMMSKRSPTKLPLGPEELVDDASETASITTSAARVSFRSLRLQESPRSNKSSHKSSEITRTADRLSRDHGSSTGRSSPIPIPGSRASPPPTIDLNIESGKLSTNRLFEPTFPDEIAESPMPVDAIVNSVSNDVGKEDHLYPKIDTTTRDELIIARRRSRRQAIKNEIERIKEEHHVHIPRRASNDHWRMRRPSRHKSSKLLDAKSKVIPDLPSPMPGTNLPLDDPFDFRASEVPGTMNEQAGLIPAVDGTSDEAPANATQIAVLENNVDYLVPEMRHSISNDLLEASTVAPASPWQTQPSSNLVGGHSIASLAQASNDILRSEIEVGRRALERLEGRMASLEAELRKTGSRVPPGATLQSSSNHTPSSSSAASRVSSASGSMSITSLPRIIQSIHHNMPSDTRTVSLAKSDNFSDDCSSPLQVQDLFYPSDDESALSSAKDHLNQMQHVACNGSPNTSPDLAQNTGPTTTTPHSHRFLVTSFSTPDMGSPTDFYRQRANRKQRY
ncbi:Mitochondrial escape protein 2 [Elsinoe australis]|uniref:Mitochondrial escape protein 2 n=1 Tax=Elsinoe australis TaxID=40998 RepID=A0A2P8A691_9PEZI|nr:Mitochondrial escape protein 2 [Elsinoe australis]